MTDRTSPLFSKWIVGGAIGAIAGFYVGGIRGAILGAIVGATVAWAFLALLTSDASRSLAEALTARVWPLIFVLAGFIAAGFFLGIGRP